MGIIVSRSVYAFIANFSKTEDVFKITAEDALACLNQVVPPKLKNKINPLVVFFWATARGYNSKQPSFSYVIPAPEDQKRIKPWEQQYLRFLEPNPKSKGMNNGSHDYKKKSGLTETATTEEITKPTTKTRTTPTTSVTPPTVMTSTSTANTATTTADKRTRTSEAVLPMLTASTKKATTRAEMVERPRTH